MPKQLDAAMNENEDPSADYPFLTPREATGGRFKTDAALAASNMRALLKHEYPGTRFKVRSETHSGGDSVDVSWTDLPGAPSEEAVDGLLAKFQDGAWNGMEDMYEYAEHGQRFRQIFGGVRRVSADQDWPTAEEIAAIPKSRINDTDENGDTLLHRVAGSGQSDLIQSLVAAGSDLNAVNNNGETALMLAGRYPETAELLRAHEQAASLSKTLSSPAVPHRHDFGNPEPLEPIAQAPRRRL
jgi:hypothetical protein